MQLPFAYFQKFFSGKLWLYFIGMWCGLWPFFIQKRTEQHPEVFCLDLHWVAQHVCRVCPFCSRHHESGMFVRQCRLQICCQQTPSTKGTNILKSLHWNCAVGQEQCKEICDMACSGFRAAVAHSSLVITAKYNAMALSACSVYSLLLLEGHRTAGFECIES